MSREDLQSRFHDFLHAAHQLDFRPVRQRQIRFSGKFRKTKKKELLHDGPPLKSGRLPGRQEVHHEILCALIRQE